MADSKPTIDAYRAGETQPLHLDVAAIMRISRATQAGLQHGMPEIGAKQLVNKILLEGREDAGTNEFNTNNKHAADLYKAVRDSGVGGHSAMYPAAVLDKAELAKRLNIPFELAWNGTGVNSHNGADGQRHAARAAQMADADKDPRNAGLVDLVNRSMKGDNTSKEQLLAMPDEDVIKSILGQNAIEEGTGAITKEGVETLKQRVNDIATNLNYDDKQRDAVQRNITLFPNEVIRSLPTIYKQAAGIDTSGDVTRSQGWAGGIKNDPASKEVMDVMLGKDPGGDRYKSAQPVPYESPSILDSIISVFK